MRNKGEILSGKIVGIVIAVICISLLIYLGTKIYPISKEKQEIIRAQNALETIINEANKLQNPGDKAKLPEFLTTPQGWWIASFHAIPGMPHYERNLPKDCQGQTCICLCKYENNYPPVNYEQCETLIDCKLEGQYTINYSVGLGDRGKYMRINPPTTESGEAFTEYTIEKTGDGIMIRFEKDFTLKPFLEHKNEQIGTTIKELLERPRLIDPENEELDVPAEQLQELVKSAFKNEIEKSGMTMKNLGLRITWNGRELLWYTEVGSALFGTQAPFCGAGRTINGVIKTQEGEVMVQMCFWEDYVERKYFGGKR